jgi:hypothetical protein
VPTQALARQPRTEGIGVAQLPQQLILALFPNEAAADEAVQSLLAWAKQTNVAPRPIGVLVLDDKGRIKEHKLGKRSGGKGAGIGLVLAAVTPPTLIAGIVGGALLGHFHHQALGLSEADRERIAGQLKEGNAAVGVMVDQDEVGAMAAMFFGKLTEFGGKPETFDVSAEAIAAADAAEAAAPAGDETPA